jgi:hypothetical protein
MFDEWCIWKYVEGYGRGLILMHYPSIFLQGLRELQKTSIGVASLQAEIWTRDLPIGKQEW